MTRPPLIVHLLLVVTYAAAYHTPTALRPKIAARSPPRMPAAVVRTVIIARGDSQGADDAAPAKPLTTYDKLKEEAANPFRALRLFLYAAGGANALIGFLVSLTQLIGVVGDAPNHLPGETVAQNLAIDLGVVVAAILLYRYENASQEVGMQQKAEQQERNKNKIGKTDLLAREAELAELQLSVVVGGEGERRNAPVRDLQTQARQHIVVVAGKAAMRSEALVKAQILGERFAKQNVLIVPVPLESVAEMRESSAMAKGFGRDTAMDKPYVAQAVGCNNDAEGELDGGEWSEYLERELEAAAAQSKQSIGALKQQGFVIVARRDGKIVRRGLGAPAWDMIIEDLQSKAES